VMIINCDDGIITKFSQQAMAPEMEERGPVSNQMKTEKGEISNGPTKTDETMKTDEGKKSGDQSQNGQLRTGGEGKDEEVMGKGNKKEEEQGGDSGEESLLRRIIRRLSMKKKKKRKGKKSAVEKEREDNSKAELDVVEPKIVEEVNIEVTSERPPTPPTAPLGRPPLPRGMSTPVSATTYHSRPVSDLDSALKAFKASTMASRENLRALGSTRDLSLLERVANRPPLARPAEQRSRVRRQPSLRVVRPQSAAEGEVEKDIKQLSSSMSCLRPEQREEPTRV